MVSLQILSLLLGVVRNSESRRMQDRCERDRPDFARTPATSTTRKRKQRVTSSILSLLAARRPVVRYNPVPCTVLSRHPFPAHRSAPEANGLQGAITPLERPTPVAPPQNRSHATQLRRVARRLSMASYLHSLHSSSYLFFAGQTAKKLRRRDLPCMRQPAHKRLRHRYPAISMLLRDSHILTFSARLDCYPIIY
jgi:hypothetical protein